MLTRAGRGREGRAGGSHAGGPRGRVNLDEVAKHPYKPRMLRHYTGTLTDIRPKGDTYYFFDGLDIDHPVF